MLVRLWAEGAHAEVGLAVSWLAGRTVRPSNRYKCIYRDLMPRSFTSINLLFPSTHTECSVIKGIMHFLLRLTSVLVLSELKKKKNLSISGETHREVMEGTRQVFWKHKLRRCKISGGNVSGNVSHLLLLGLRCLGPRPNVFIAPPPPQQAHTTWLCSYYRLNAILSLILS